MSSSTKSNGVVPLEMEQLSFTRNDGFEQDVSSTQSPQQQQFFHPCQALLYWFQNLGALIAAYASYYSHITIPVVAVCVIVAVILGLDFIVSASTHKKHVAMVKHDYTDSHSVYELKMQLVDHWCLSGGDDDCRCDDPTMAMSNEQMKGWLKAHKYNKLLLDTSSNPRRNVDVVLVGDQVMEEWNARWYGTPNDEYKGVKTYFDKTFTRAGGGDIEGVALGVAGDSISNLLWRLQHGEMPDSLYPSVWWILIGGNDLNIGQCSEEVVVLGILRLAELIAEQKPGSVIVINSILPALTTVRPRMKTAHFKEFDLFPSIQVINEQLEKFCQKHATFEFFDATPLFFESPLPTLKEMKKKKGRSLPLPALKTNLIGENGKLTVAGHKVWGDAIALEVKKLMQDSVSEQQYGDGPLVDDMFDADDYNI